MNVIELLINSISFGISANVFMFLALAYKKYNYPSLKYFISSSFLFLINTFIAILNNIFEGFSFGMDALIYNFNFASVIWAIFLNLLFFRTFWYENPLNKITIIFGVMITMHTMGSIMLSYLALGFENTLFSDLQRFEELTYLGELSYNLEIFGNLSLMLSFYGLFCILGSMILIELQLKSRISNAHDENIKKILKRMRNGNWFFILGGVVVGLNRNIGLILLTSGYAIMYFSYLRGGLFILQEETLRRLIIMDSIGLLKYSYEFRKFASKESKDDEDMDILFTGALKAVSSLLGELTGADQELKEIRLNKMNLLVGRTSDNQLTLVLLVDKSTKFFREAFSQVQKKVLSKIGDYEPNEIFNQKISSKLDLLIQNSFGLGE
ncbi:MAG: membrane protein of unknown function [Promethearchaeota archaeon]|nr:MAG: membrane protein of unknown function [Candidatus Lokiarchaeota archaeon]